MSSRLLLTKLTILLLLCLSGVVLSVGQVAAQTVSLAGPTAQTLCVGQTYSFTANAVVGGNATGVQNVVINYTSTGTAPGSFPATFTSNGNYVGSFTVPAPVGSGNNPFSFTAVATFTTGTGSTTTASSASIQRVGVPAASGFSVAASSGTICQGSALTLTGAPSFTLTAVSGPFGPNGANTTVPPTTGGAGFATNPTQFTIGSGGTINTGTFSVTAVDGNGCPATATTNVSVTTPTVTSILPLTNTVCYAGTSVPVALTVSGSTGVQSVTATLLPGNFTQTSSGSVVTLGIGSTGNFSVVAAYTDVNGCVSTSATSPTVTIQSVDVPSSIGFNAPTALVCPGTTASYTALSNGGTTSYTLLLANGTVATSTTVLQPSSQGVLTFTMPDATTGMSGTLIAGNAAGCTTSIGVTITSAPAVTAAIGVAGVIQSSVTVCSGTVLNLSRADNPGGPGTPVGVNPNPSYTSLWASTAGPVSATSSSPITFTATTSGVVTVTLTNGSSCSAIGTLNVTVNQSPTISVVATPGTVCTGSVVTFALSSTTAAGTSLTSAYGNVATGGTQFSPQTLTAVYSYTSTATAAGVMNAAFVAYDGKGCQSNVTSATVLVLNAVTATEINPVGSATVCAGGLLTLTATAGAATSYSLVGPNGLISTTATSMGGLATFTVNAPSTGTAVSYTAISGNGFCTTSASVSVAITAIPAAPTVVVTNNSSLSTATSICGYTGATFTVSASCATGSLYIVQAGNSGIPASPPINATSISFPVTQGDASAQGAYSYTFTCQTTNGCASSATSGTVTFTTVPTVSVSTPVAVCSGTPFSLTATGGPSSLTGLTYAWSGSGITAGGNTSVVTGSYSNTTSAPVTVPYTVTVTSLDGCSVTATVNQPVNPQVRVSATLASSVVCAGSPQTLTLTVNGGVYNLGVSGSLVSGAGTGVTPTSFVVSPFTGGITSPNRSTVITITVPASSTGGTAVYSVTGLDGAGCSSTPISVSFVINPLPPVTVVASGNGSTGATSTPNVFTFCAGTPVTLTVPGSASATFTPTGSTQAGTQIGPNSYAVGAQPTTFTATYSVAVASSATCGTTTTATVVFIALPASPIVTTSGLTSGGVCLSSVASLSINCPQGVPSVNGVTLGTTSTNVFPVPTSQVGVTSYSVVCISPNADKCPSVPVIIPVTVNARPQVTLSAPAGACAGQTITLTASTADGNQLNFSTGFGNAVSANQVLTTSVIFGNAPTQYSVTATNAVGCTSTTTVSVSVNPAVTFNTITAPAVCAGQTVTVTAAASGGTGLQYSFNGGAAQTTGVFTVITTSASQALTVYPISVTNASGCSSSTTVQVVVNSNPTPTISPASQAICQGTLATLEVIGSASSYSWSTGESGPAVSSIKVGTAGTYTVIVTNSVGCTAAATATVTVNTPPTVSITPSSTVACPGTTVTLSASGSNLSYAWSNGQLGSSIIVTAGTYSVTATDVNGCKGSASVTVTQGVTPTATVTPSNPVICAGQSTTLTASGAGVGGTYVWTPGNQTGASIVVTPATTAAYNVVVTNAQGCSATAGTTVFVTPAPSLQIVGTTTIYAGQTTSLIATGATSYSWNTGSTASTISVSPAIPTTYTVTGTAAGCSSTTTVTVNVLPIPGAPQVSPAGNVQACVGQTILLTAVCAPGTQPRFKTQNTTLDAASFSVQSNVSYTAVCVATNAIGTVEGTPAVGSVTFNAVPVASISGGSNAICAGSSAVLTATGGGSYLWSNGSTSPSITVNPMSTTTYSVTVTSAAGCTATASQVVNVNQLPTVLATASPSTIFAGQSATLQASSVPAGVAYQWSNGAGGATVNVSPTTTTVYTVTVTAAGTFCQNTATVTVTVNPAPQAPIVTPGTNLQACLGNNVVLTASCPTPGSTAQFVRGNLVINQPTYSVESPVAGPVSILAYCSVNGVQSAATPITVTFNASPNVTISGDPKICNTSGTVTGATLTASGATSYLWSNGATTPTITVTTPGVISVTGTTGGCAASQSVTTFSAVCGTGQALAITGASINCTTRQITINTTGGDGTAIDGRILLVTNFQPSTQPLILDAGVFEERKPVTLQVRQSGVTSAMFTFDYSAQCPASTTTTPPPSSTTAPAGNTITVCGQPYVLTGAQFAVGATFQCNTGATPHQINFVPAGGVVNTNSVIEFMSIGITGWTQNCSAQLDPGNTDNNRFTIMARQRDTQTGAILQTATVTVTSPCQPKTGAGREATTADALEVTVLGNPTLSDKVEVEVRGAEGQRLQLRMTDGQGASVSEIAVEKANSVERQTLGLGRSAGMYFLQVITPSKVKTVKVIRQ